MYSQVPKKKRKATVGRICRKGKFSAWNERVIISMNVSSITTVYHVGTIGFLFKNLPFGTNYKLVDD